MGAHLSDSRYGLKDRRRTSIYSAWFKPVIIYLLISEGTLTPKEVYYCLIPSVNTHEKLKDKLMLTYPSRRQLLKKHLKIMDFKKISIIFIMCVLCSSCNFFLKPFYEDVVSDYSSKWMLVNNTGSCLEIKMWNKGSVLFAFQTSRQTEFLNGEKVCVYSKESDNTIQFSSLISYFKSDVDYFLHCDSITFESCDGSEVYHVWHTTGVDNGEPFYQEENWRYESKDNGYTNCWYYTLTPEFVLE